MKIIVAIKQVPERDAQVRIAANGKWIEEADLQWAMNEPDAYALEEALAAQREARRRSDRAQRRAGARGLDDSRGPGQGRGPGDPHRLRRPGRARCAGRGALLAAAIKPENPDLVLTGLQSEDLGLGQTGVILAELLGLPHATLILHVEKTESASR
jgi:electron transfer flavoprotein beta subunit